MKKFILPLLVLAMTTFVISLTSCKSSSPAAAATPVPTCTILGESADVNTNGWAAGYMAGNTITASSTIVARSIWAKMPGTANYFALAIYSDASGLPGTLMVHTDITADNGGWIKVSIPPTTLTAGNNYWLLAVGETGGVTDNTSATGSVAQYYFYGWNNILSSGFPTDISGAACTAWVSSKNMLYVSTCE